jgi:twitching motility two-component system response regulator PilH
MHLKLRRKRLRPPLPGAADTASICRKSFIPGTIYQPNTTALSTESLAADVHLYSAENYGEKSAVQKKVLIVDDSPAQVKLIQGLLEPEGYPSVGLNDPRRIEETITAERPCMILLDVVMPDRNGFQICRDLKSSTEFNAIPVILVTSKDTVSDRYWGQQQGADGYVTKPFTREELLRAVRRFA